MRKSINVGVLMGGVGPAHVKLIAEKINVYCKGLAKRVHLYLASNITTKYLIEELRPNIRPRLVSCFSDNIDELHERIVNDCDEVLVFDWNNTVLTLPILYALENKSWKNFERDER